jgi:hypothetical protein
MKRSFCAKQHPEKEKAEEEEYGYQEQEEVAPPPAKCTFNKRTEEHEDKEEEKEEEEEEVAPSPSKSVTFKMNKSVTFSFENDSELEEDCEYIEYVEEEEEEGSPTFEKIEGEVLQELHGLPEIYCHGHRMNMQSCFEDSDHGPWEKYLDELRQLQSKSGELRDDGDKEKPEEREVEVCVVLDAEMPLQEVPGGPPVPSCICDSSPCPSSGWSERPQ